MHDPVPPNIHKPHLWPFPSMYLLPLSLLATMTLSLHDHVTLPLLALLLPPSIYSITLSLMLLCLLASLLTLSLQTTMTKLTVPLSPYTSDPVFQRNWYAAPRVHLIYDPAPPYTSDLPSYATMTSPCLSMQLCHWPSMHLWPRLHSQLQYDPASLCNYSCSPSHERIFKNFEKYYCCNDGINIIFKFFT